MPGTAPIEGKPFSLSPNVPVQAKSALVSSQGSSVFALALQGRDLGGQERVASGLVVEVFVLAADDHAAVGGGADVQIRLGGFPDEIPARPETLRLGRRRIGPGARALMARLSARRPPVHSRSQTPGPWLRARCRRPSPSRLRVQWHHLGQLTRREQAASAARPVCSRPTVRRHRIDVGGAIRKQGRVAIDAGVRRSASCRDIRTASRSPGAGGTPWRARSRSNVLPAR